MKNIKKVLFILLVLILPFVISCTKTNTPDKEKLDATTKFMLAEEESSFNFFWETQNIKETSGGCGLIPDRYPSSGLASIASVGFGLASFVVGAYKKYVTNESRYKRPDSKSNRSFIGNN